MKRLALFLLCLNPGYAAISALMQWDVRTTGDDANGGAFKLGATGTDFSMQDLPQITYSDLVVGATTTEVTSILNPFADGTSVGNIINILSGAGCTAGRFEVKSVAAGVATLDRSAGTAASSCAANLGGSLLTIGAVAAAVNQGNSIYIQSGTYTLTTRAAFVTSPYYASGYQTTHNDNGTKPLITTATNSTKLWGIANSGGGASVILTNLSFSNTASVRAAGLTNFNTVSAISVRNCVFDGFTIAIDASGDEGGNIVGDVSISNTEIKNGAQAINTNAVFSQNIGNIYCFACYVHDMTSAFGAIQGSPIGVITLSFSVVAATSLGVGGVSQINLWNTNIVNNTNGVNSLREVVNCQNSIFYNNSATAITVNHGNPVSDTPPACGNGQSNAFGANGTKYNAGQASLGEITLTASPFTSATNFTLNATAGGGVLCKGHGAVASITGSTTVGGIDVGAIQSQQGGGGGASAFTQ